MSGNAQLTKKIVYWQHSVTGTIKMGLPEEYPAPDYHQKIICGTVQEAEHWSQKMRNQERDRAQIEDEKRDEAESRNRSQIRSHIFSLMANARNNFNRDFLKYYMAKYGDGPNDPTKVNRESFLHSEGYEQGR